MKDASAGAPGSGLSHVRGAAAPPLRDDTIGAALGEAARKWPDREALVSVHQGLRLTFADLAVQADAIAAGLLALGLEPGDRIGVWSPNKAEWALTQFAAARAGLILVTVNPAYRLSEVEYTVNKVGMKALVCAERLKTSDYVGMIGALAPELETSWPGQLAAARMPTLTAAIKIGGEPRRGWLDFDELAGLARPVDVDRLAAISASLTASDPINIQFTSGTTGLPKGATLSHRNILNNGYFVGRAIGLREGDRLCIPVPLYHCFGMVMGNLACLTHGATMVYPSDAFDPQAVMAAVQAERCTGLYGVPTMFIAVLGHPDFEQHDLSSLRTGCMAGSPCPVEVMKQVISRLHMSDITIAYGYSVMLGYWQDPERTAEAVDADGWMHTGDLATLDHEGYGNIVGRLKDMVIRGGENIYPREVEEFLYRHPKVADVTVVGVPDERFGEALCAWIQLKPGEVADADEITAFCQGEIAHYKIPHYIRFVEAFPMTVTGKVQKYMIREQMIDELNLTAQRTA